MNSAASLYTFSYDWKSAWKKAMNDMLVTAMTPKITDTTMKKHRQHVILSCASSSAAAVNCFLLLPRRARFAAAALPAFLPDAPLAREEPSKVVPLRGTGERSGCGADIVTQQ